MALLSFRGISTPSLPAQGGQRRFSYFNISRGNPETELVVEAELPGMDEKDVSVTLSSGVLTLKGKKKSEREEKKDDYHLMERSYGSFQRSFQLADTIDPDKVTATFDKGVLKVTLPKRPEAVKAEKRIPIGKS
jgi:HSP20 family protein